MLGFEERLISIISEFRQMENETLPFGLSREQLIDLLEEKSAKCRRLMEANTRLLRERLYPMLEDAENLSDSEADDLSELAQRLYTLINTLDMGLAMVIHTALLRRAREKQDPDRIVRHIYWIAIIYMYLDKSLFLEESLALFAEGAGFRENYLTIESKETRMYINRCLGNVYVACSGFRSDPKTRDEEHFFRIIDEALAFWNDPTVRALDPDFPWAAFTTNPHQNICAWLDLIRINNERGTPLVKRIDESLLILTEGEAQGYANRNWPPSRLTYVQLSMNYHSERCDLVTLVSELRQLFNTADEDDYSTEGMFRMLHVPAALLIYLKHEMGGDSARFIQESTPIIQRILRYCRNTPDGIDRQRINSFLGEFGMSNLAPEQAEEYLSLVLDLISFIHMPIYVHCLQTGFISSSIAEYLIDQNPEQFVGLCGTTSVEEIAQYKYRICDLVRRAGIFHDIGKIEHVNTISMISRPFFDFEEKITQTHVHSEKLELGTTEDLSCIMATLNGHHIWADSQGGYPCEEIPIAQPYKSIVDIVAVADSLDAGTDEYGHTFRSDQSFDRVLSEIHAQAGTRYAAWVVAALTDAELLEDLRNYTSVSRQETYYAAYVKTSRA
ncbi:MAG: hypothetical protein FWE76_01025 [Symbiobacteriaceae bacterium]|nr:hypothetical protein [Symbiobacteriaceae bacterium]